MNLKSLNRVYYNQTLSEKNEIILEELHFNYLINVLRLTSGKIIKIFNENDGEFLATIRDIHKKTLTLIIKEQLRQPKPTINNELIIALAIIKLPNFLNAIDMAVQIGVDSILPLITQYTQLTNINTEKIHKRIIEATEQSGRMRPPNLLNSMKLLNLSQLDGVFLYANEYEDTSITLRTINIDFNKKITLIIGPEGGFSTTEVQTLASYKNFYSFSIASNILRSETATIAALSQIYQLRN